MSNTFTAGRGMNAQELTRLGAAVDGSYTFPAAAGGAVTPSSGLTVAIAAILANYVWINSTLVTTAYSAGTDTVAAADATNPRIDTVVFQSDSTVDIVTGTPVAVTATTGPTPPTIASTQIAIADIYVAAGATTILSSNITDRRQGQGLPLRLVKSATETVNGSSTLQDDDTFQFEVEASKDYEIDAELLLATGQTPDWKFAWTLTGMTWTGRWVTSVQESATYTWDYDQDVASAASKTITVGTNATATMWNGHFVIHAGSTGGTLKFQWAQGTSDASNTSVLKSSRMTLTKLGAS